MRRLIILCLLMLMLASCAKSSPSATPTKIKEVINIAIDHSPVSLCPVETMDEVSHLVAAPLYHRLFTYNENGQLVPDAIAEWELVDELTYHFTLKSNLVFHNGDPLVADDVIYTLKRVSESPLWGNLLYGVKVDELKAEDEHNIILTTAAPIPDLTTSLAATATSILNHRLGEDYDYTQQPVGTGPYYLEEWRAGQFISYEVNPHLLEEVKNDGLIYWIIPDREERIQALEDEHIQVVTAIDSPQTIRPLNTGRWINDLPTSFLAVVANRNLPPMDNPVMPHALRLLTDPKEIMAFIGGHAHGGVIPYAAKFHETNPETGFHLREQGVALMKEAGHDELILSLAILEGDESMEALAGLLERQWTGYGLQLVIHRYQSEDYLTSLKTGKDHLYLQRIVLHTLDPSNMLNLCFRTDPSGTTANYSRLSDKAVDEFIRQGDTTLDPAQRMEIYRSLQERLDELAPWLFIWEPVDAIGVSTKLSIPEPPHALWHPERLSLIDNNQPNP